MDPVPDLGPHAPPVPVLSRDYWEPVYPVTEVCEWTREYDYWASGCDYAFDLVDGGTPAENDYTFCPRLRQGDPHEGGRRDVPGREIATWSLRPKEP